MTRKTIKCVGYAYATSKIAKSLGKGKEGSWYLALTHSETRGRKYKQTVTWTEYIPFSTLDDAVSACELANGETDPWSVERDGSCENLRKIRSVNAQA